MRGWLDERSLECWPRPGKPRKTSAEQDMKIIEAGIFFKRDSDHYNEKNPGRS
jgi:hypothetical protein